MNNQNEFINNLRRDRARGSLAPHQIVLLISFFHLHHNSSSTDKFNIKELVKEFDLNWDKYDHLFKSRNKNIGLPLKALYNKELLAISVFQPIEDFRNIGELLQKIERISLSTELTRFLNSVSLEYLETRINN